MRASLQFCVVRSFFAGEVVVSGCATSSLAYICSRDTLHFNKTDLHTSTMTSYSLLTSYAGQSLIQGFNFISSTDPSHGFVS